MLDTAVREAVERILAKVRESRKLTDSEVTLLLVGELAKRMGSLEKRIEEVKSDLNKRIDDSRDIMTTKMAALEKRVEEVKESLEKRIDDSRDVMATRITALEKRVEGLEAEVRGLRSEVSLIRSDVIMLLKSWLEGKREEGR